MEKKPLITTIIPTFQRSHLLRRAVDSALKQTVKEIQVAVFDNCSCDDTEQVVKEIQAKDPRVLYFFHQKPLKAQENFQYGLFSVKTPFFSILADDDYLLPNFYEIALDRLYKYPEAQFFVGSTLDVNEKGDPLSANAIKWPQKELFFPPEGVFQQIEKYINWTGALFRREILEKNQLDLEVNAIDYDFMIRLSAQYPFAFSQKACASFVHHAGGYSSYTGSKLLWPSFQKIMVNAKNEIPSKDWAKAEQLLQGFLKRSLFGIGCKALKLGSFREAKEVAAIFSDERRFRYLKFLIETCEETPFFYRCFGLVLNLYHGSKAWLNRIKFLLSKLKSALYFKLQN